MVELPAIASGAFLGFTVNLIGGGGSIVATPLLLYAVGLSPHVVIGTGALAVSANAFVNFGGHARAVDVRWAASAQWDTLTRMFAALVLVFAFYIIWRSVGST